MKVIFQAERFVVAMISTLLTLGPILAQDKLTLAQAVERALENNPELAIDAPMREAASSELAASRSGYLPHLDFEQSYLGGNNPVFVFGTLLTQRRFTADNFALPSLNTPDPVQNFQTRVSVQQTIWDAGRTGRQLETARLGLTLTDQSHDQHVRQVLLAVLESYYSVSLSREAWNSARVAIQSAEAIVKQAQSRVESGLAVEADLLRSQAYLATMQQQEIRAKGQMEVAKAMLNRLMGEPLESSQGATSELTPAAYSLPSDEVLLSELRQRRPDYQKLLSELQQAELQIRSNRANYYPDIGAFASWEADNIWFKHTGGTNWSAGLTLRWNIYSGGSNEALLKATKHRLEAKQRQLDAMESAMALEVHKAVVEYKSAEQQVQAAQAAEAQSGESLRILQNRYDVGLATMTDLLSAETARSTARTALAQAIFQQRLGYAQVEYAAGILSPTSAAMK